MENNLKSKKKLTKIIESWTVTWQKRLKIGQQSRKNFGKQVKIGLKNEKKILENRRNNGQNVWKIEVKIEKKTFKINENWVKNLFKGVNVR